MSYLCALLDCMLTELPDQPVAGDRQDRGAGRGGVGAGVAAQWHSGVCALCIVSIHSFFLSVFPLL